MIKYEDMTWYDYKLIRNANALIDKTPVMLRLYLTTACNSRCYYCSNISPESAVLDPDLACRLIAAFADAGGKSVQLSGGEPSLYDGWWDVVYACGTLNLDWAYFTNGVEVKTGVIMHQYPPAWVRISLDAGSVEVYKSIHGNDFNTVLDNIEYLVNTFKTAVIGTSFVICERNYNEISLFVKMSKELGVKYCRITYARYSPEEAFIDSVQKEIEESFDITTAMASKGFEVAILKDRKKLPFPRDCGLGECHYSDLVITVGADGWVYPCCLALYDYDQRLINLNEKLSFSHTVDIARCPKCDKIEKNLHMKTIMEKYLTLGWKRDHWRFL